MLPRNVTHYFVMNAAETRMYGHDGHGQMKMIFNLPWLRPFLFCSATEAQQFATTHRAIVRKWPGKLYENKPTDNVFRS